jgi:hypothetical protein
LCNYGRTGEEKLATDFTDFTDIFSHKKAQKAQRKISHRFHRFTLIFLTLIAPITQRGFGRLAFCGKAFSRSELL